MVKTLRRILTGTVLGLMLACLASANQIGFLDSQGVVTFSADGTYTMTLPDFNPAGGTLTPTEATIYLYAAENVQTLSLTNTSVTTETFNLDLSSNMVRGSTNTATETDKYTGEVLDLFDTGIGINASGGPDYAPLPVPAGTLTLGGSGTPSCPTGAASSACSSVSYTPPNELVQNIDPVYGFNTGTGIQGVDGVIENITGADLANYIGVGTFNIAGGTETLADFQGGDEYILLVDGSTASFEAEIDYSYSVSSSTPEPATRALMCSALIGLGLLGSRFKRKQS